MNTYGWTPGTFVAQYAPWRLSGRTGASIQASSKNRSTAAPASLEKSPYASTTIAARLVPRRLRRVLGDGREAVVVLEPVEPEQLRLEPVVALRHVVARGGGIDQRLHGVVGRLVREVPRRDPGRVAAQPVVDPLVDEDRVEDRGARAQARLEGGGDGLGRSTALVAVGRVELRHRRLERDRLGFAGEVDAHGTEHLLVEPRPGRDAGDGLLGEDLLLRLRQQVRAEHALRREPVAPVVERRVREEQLGRPVLDRGPLEPEEEELGLEARRPSRRASRRARRGRGRPCSWRSSCARSRGRASRSTRSARARRSRPRARPRRGSRPCRSSGHGRRCGRFGFRDVTLDARVVAGGVEVGEVPRDLFGTGLLDGCHGGGDYRP